ncbi:MAG: pseudouridine synthase, partial [Myxococcales bacterium]|nr:pseudouridine synthase [Myxococcales bacterium]
MTFDVWPDWRSRDVVYRDEHLLVVDKPAGVPSQAAEPEHDDDVVARLKRYLAVERGVAPEEVYLGLHQRLDRGTSGLMCFALAREMNAGLARQFEGRTVGKGYVAAVQGRLPGGGGAPRTLRDLLAKGKGGVMR